MNDHTLPGSPALRAGSFNIAQGSLSEIDTQVELAHMLGYMASERHSALMLKMTEISKMLYGLTNSLK